MEEAVTESIIRQANRTFVQEDTTAIEQQETGDAIINVETFIQAHKDSDKLLAEQLDLKQERTDESQPFVAEQDLE